MPLRRSRHKANFNHFRVVERMIDSHIAAKPNGIRVPKYVVKNVTDYLDKQHVDEVLSIDEIDSLTNYFESLNSDNRLTLDSYNAFLCAAAKEYAKLFISVAVNKPADEFLIKFKNSLVGIDDRSGKYFDKLTTELEESAEIFQMFRSTSGEFRLSKIKLLLEEINRARTINGIDERESILEKPQGFFAGGFVEATQISIERDSLEALRNDRSTYYNKAYNAILNDTDLAIDYLAVIATTPSTHTLAKILRTFNVSIGAHSSHLKLASIAVNKVARALVDNPLVTSKDPKMLEAIFKNSSPSVILKLLSTDAIDPKTIWNKYVFIKRRDDTNVKESRLTKSFVIEKMLENWPELAPLDLLDTNNDFSALTGVNALQLR